MVAKLSQYGVEFNGISLDDSSVYFENLEDGHVVCYSRGAPYFDRHGYKLCHSAYYEFEPSEIKLLHKYLEGVISKNKLSEKKTSTIYGVPKIRVYKRFDSWQEILRGVNNQGFSIDRPWMCSATPQDGRASCYLTWEDAMAWATMPDEKRAEQVYWDSKSEMGQ